MVVQTQTTIKPDFEKTRSHIPKDWIIEPISKNIEIVMGQSPSGETYNQNEGVPLLNGPTEFGPTHPTPIQYTTKPTKISKIGDVLLCVRGSTTGRLNISDQKYCIGRGLASIRGISGKTDTKWVFYQFVRLQNYIFDIASGGGSTFPNINRIFIERIELPFPSLPEQQKIAEVLSDIDVLIEKLEENIIKKQNIRQGVMQELLSGKSRLPGFEDKWENKILSDLGQFRGGNGFPLKYQGKTEGVFPFFKVSDMNNSGNEIFMTFSNNYITEDIKNEIGPFVFPAHTIVFAKIGAAIFLERRRMLLHESCFDNNLMGYIVYTKKTNLKFLYYVMKNIKLGKLVSTTALPSLKGKELEKLSIYIPSDQEEQEAIGQTLSDMDTELNELKKKREKHFLIKIGMMQKLLTGEIRLR